jgi:hypothetical protein
LLFRRKNPLFHAKKFAEVIGGETGHPSLNVKKSSSFGELWSPNRPREEEIVVKALFSAISVADGRSRPLPIPAD